MPEPKDIRINEEERLIPVWSIVLASLAFVLVEYYFWVVAPEQRHHTPPPLGLRSSGRASAASVLKWIVGPAPSGRAVGKETSIGWMPSYEEIEWRGLDFRGRSSSSCKP